MLKCMRSVRISLECTGLMGDGPKLKLVLATLPCVFCEAFTQTAHYEEITDYLK